MLNLHRKYQLCLTVAAGYRAESVYCTTYTIRGLQSSEAGTSYLLNLKKKFVRSSYFPESYSLK